MTFKELKNKIKEEQKTLAQEIREQKSLRKSTPGGYVPDLNWNRLIYREHHIAYCEFFNRTPYSKIESPKEDNRPSRHSIELKKEKWTGQIDEALRDCA